MRPYTLPLLASLLVIYAVPTLAAPEDFEDFNVGDDLTDINDITGPGGLFFDGVSTTQPPVIVADPGNAAEHSLQAGTLPAGADILILADVPFDTFRIRYPDEPTQSNAVVTLLSYNHVLPADTIQGTGGVLSFLQGTEPTSLELNGNGMWAVQAELSGSPIIVDDVEFLILCGNGYWGIGEECDDGNTTNGDGCDATCLWEPAFAGMLRNGDFEISEPVGGAIPTVFGDWDTDASLLVSSNGDVLPRSGDQMLCFDSTGLLPDSGGTSGDVRQFIDVSHLAPEIEAGDVTATASVFFNRASSKGPQDTALTIDLRAHDETPATFGGSKDALALGNATLVSDADPNTWEELSVDLPIPPGTTYLELNLSAIENVFDDPTRPAFEGQCADDVTLQLSVTGAGICGDGVVNSGEQCDDGNTVSGDGCSALCQDEAVVDLCAPAPLLDCSEAAKGSLSIVEKKLGNEKWKLGLKGFSTETTAASFGDPVSGGTAYATCIYDGSDALVTGAVVERAGQTCGPKSKPCWKAKGNKGWNYKDSDAGAQGVRKLALQSGTAGKGKLALQAGNKAKKSQASLPVGVAALLQDTASVRVQVVA
ncbi:MAG: myxococcus cysteine-rich repeat containing protein, partial [Myxococcota bacterium]